MGKEGTATAMLSDWSLQCSCHPFKETEWQIIKERDQSQVGEGARDPVKLFR